VQRFWKHDRWLCCVQTCRRKKNILFYFYMCSAFGNMTDNFAVQTHRHKKGCFILFYMCSAFANMTDNFNVYKLAASQKGLCYFDLYGYTFVRTCLLDAFINQNTSVLFWCMCVCSHLHRTCLLDAFINPRRVCEILMYVRVFIYVFQKK
jgi:hypothetical protein